MFPKLFRLVAAVLLISFPFDLLAAPTAVDDAFSVNEDTTLSVALAGLVDTGFDTGGGSSISFAGDWAFLDEIENENGASQGYPVDGVGRAWSDPDFDPSTSTIGSWSTGAMPLQAGGIGAFPGEPDGLAGIDAADNGENLVTTYLFRNSFTATAAQAVAAQWSVSLLADDGCAIYVNGTEVLRHRLPAGGLTTETYATNSNPDESQYEQLVLSLPSGLIVAGANTIAVELHQASPSSSDVGIDLELQEGAGGGLTGGFSYVDDAFGTGNPSFAAGQHEASGGFNGTGGLQVRVGGRTPNGARDSSGGWRRQFTLGADAVLDVSLRYRLVANSGFEAAEFAMALAEIDGARLGNDTNTSLAYIQGNGNGGGDDDTGWRQVSFTVPLAAGSHELALGVYVNRSTVASEVADVYFDDVVISGGGGGSGGVLTNDTGDAASLAATLLTQPDNGSVTMSPDGTFTYVADGDFFGADTFTYLASDNSGNSLPATVTITIDPVNDAPTGVAKSYMTAEDQVLSPAAGLGVLQGAGDIDNASGELTAVLASDVSTGSLVLNPSGAFTYSPASDFSGEAMFTYRVSDGVAQSQDQTVTITVTPVDDPPVAVADSYSVDENGQLVVSIAQGGGDGAIDLVVEGASWKYLDDGSDQGVGWIATNFDDASWQAGTAQLGYGDGDESTEVGFGPDDNDKYATTYFRKTFDVANAAIFESLELRLLRDDGAAVYLNGSEIARSNLVAEAAFDVRTDSIPGAQENVFFEFDVNLDLLQSGTNVLAVEVHQSDPDSSDLSFDLSLSGTVTVVRGVLANDQDPEGEKLVASVETTTAQGALALNPDGTFTYTPAANFFGEDQFQYEVSDGGEMAVGTTTITVVPGPNDVPDAVADSYTVMEDRNLAVDSAAGVLGNDSDTDGDAMSAVLVSDVEHGVLELEADGAFSYLPAGDYFGSDRFVYRAADGLGQSGDTEVTISVTGVNDVPFARGDSFVVQPGEEFGGDVLGNDVDVDGDTLSVTLAGGFVSGTLDLSEDGSFTYDPGVFVGTTSFSYTANDASSSSSVTQVSLVVNGRPSALADGYSVAEDSSLVVPAELGFLSNDSDPEGATVTAQLQAGVANGVLEFAADGAFSYTPEPDFFGTDAFTYVLTDGVQSSLQGLVTISVQPVNDPPLPQADDYGVVTDELFSADASDGVLGNDTDADGDDLVATLLTNVSSGALSLATDGSFTYTPATDFEGEDSFTYRVSDGTASSDETVTLYVGPDLKTVIINEIMYHPASDNDLEEFIELTNIGPNDVDLSGWTFGDGVEFTFPAVILPSGGFVVIAADVATFEAAYGTVANLVGGWGGRLSNSGERVRLYDSNGVEIDDLIYADEGEWAARERVSNAAGWDWNSAHDGGGQSLELVFAGLSNKQGQNWAPSQGAATPGAANTSLATQIAPMILDVAHRPVVPRSDEAVRITARLLDVEGTPFSASLFWRQAPMNPAAFAELEMVDDGANGDGEAGDGVYGASLPAMADGTVVEFYISASDGTGVRTWPAVTNIGQVANAHYQVDDEEHSGNWPIYRIVMTAEEDDAFASVNRSSNERFHATLILDDCSGPVIRYNSSLRVRGAGSRSHNPPPMRVNVPHDDPWNARTAMNWNTKYTYLQYAGMRLFQGSGMAAPDGKPMRVRWNGEDRMRDDRFDYGMAVHMEVLDGDFIDDKYPDDKEGNLYKKTRPDRDWAFRDGDAGDYLSDGWSKKTNADENDWADLDQFLGVMNNSPGAGDYVAQVEAVADLDQWLQWFGAMAILANGETNPSTGVDDDHSLYRGVEDPRFQFVPHDLDTILGKGDGSSISDPEHTIFDMISRGSALDPLVPLFSDPGVQLRYYQALRELLQGSFAKAEFDELIDNSLAGWVPSGQIDDLKTFMDERRVYITGLIDAELGAAPPAPSPTTSATLSGAHGALMISEVLAVNQSAASINGTFPDYVELHNSGPTAISVAGMTMTDDLSVPGKFVFPAGSSVPAGGYLRVLGDSEFAQPLLHLGFGLGANGDAIYLLDSGTTVDGVVFGLQISDHSIGRTGAGLNTWTLNTPTPAAANVAQPVGDPDGLRLNEWLAQPEIVLERDFIEIYNPSVLPVALGGLAITDEPASEPTRFQLPALSFIPASGFSVFEAIGNSASPGNASELPFKLGSDQGWLAISGANGVGIDQVHYLCHSVDVSQGRSPDGAADYADYLLPTPGFSNETDLSNESAIVTGLRITELMYRPAGSGSEYVELRNVGDEAFDLSGVAFTDGIDFTFPSMVLQPGEFVLVVENPVAFETAFGSAPNVAGGYSGKLSNGGEHLRLEIPSLGAGIHDFDYDDAWYPSTDGSGFALEIIDDQAASITWREKERWRAGSITGGSPGTSSVDPAAYDRWVVEQFGAPSAGLTGKLDDPDLDGVANVLEFVFGSDPEVGLRGEMFEFTNEGGFLTMIYKRAVSSIGLVQLVPQVSGDNQSWVSGDGVTVQQLLGSDGTFETWKVRDATPIGSGQRRFLRIRAICLDE